MSGDNRDRLGLALLLLALKGGLLLGFGPAQLPDTGGYVAFAQIILDGGLGDAGLNDAAIPITLFRVIGYPAVIALCQGIAGGHWPWLLVTLQIILSVAALMGVHGLARRFGLSRGMAAAVVLATGTSLSLVLDQAVLTDSLYSSALVLCLCLLSAPLAAGLPLRPVPAFGAGLLFAIAFLLREATLFLTVGIAPLVVLAAFGGMRLHRVPVLRALLVGGLFLLPIAVTQQGYREWNRDRVGAPIITTGAQTNMFFAVATAAHMDRSVLDGDAVANRTARDIYRNYEFVEVLTLVQTLFQQHGMNAIDQTRVGFQTYFAAWRDHFPAMAQMVLGHFRANQAQLSLRPVESIRELILWTRHDDGGFGRWRAVREGRWWMAPVMVVDGVAKALAILVFTAFTLLTPWRLLRGDGRTPANSAAIGLWLLYFAQFSMYALVHLETRYMAALVPSVLVVGTCNLHWLYQHWKRGRRASPNDL